MIYTSQNSSSSDTPITSHITNTSEEIVEFEGKLTKFDDSCKVDAACKAVVNEFTIIINPGEMEVPALGQSEIWNDDIGKMVKVRAKRVNDTNLTLVGNPSLYVKLVD